MAGSAARPRLAVVGTSGYARTYLHRARTLHDEGTVRFVGVCDIREPAPDAMALLPAGVRAHLGIDALLAACAPDITVVATPPHTHLPLGATVLAAGSDLLLETPPVLDIAGFQELAELTRRTGRACQVGFQSFGSAALPILREVIGRGELGRVIGVGAAGAWVRTDAYYARNPWAGRRWLDGQAVVDGALTNPFCHAVATSLLAAGVADREPVEIALELYGARHIEADDTACLRIRFHDGPDIVVAASLCAEQDHEPYLVVHGTGGRATFWYKTRRLEVNDTRFTVAPPTDLLRNLVDHHRDPAGVELLAPLRGTGAFATVMQAVRDAPGPRPIPDGWIRSVGHGPARHSVVRGISEEITVAAERLALFSELGVPWADATRRWYRHWTATDLAADRRN
jgi:predicted dehydrogenase